MKKGGEWIQDAIKSPGSLRKELHTPKGKNIPEKKLESAAKAPGKLGKRARMAETLKELHKRHGGECDEKMAKGGECKTEKMAAGGAAKERKGFPNTNKPPKKLAKGGEVSGKAGARKGIARKGARFQGTFATGGKVRGCGAATKGCNFSGIY
jgi:hypothetical protein